MLAGRPHEAVGNGSPRWMAVGPRKRAHRTRPTGRLTPRLYLIVRDDSSVEVSRDFRFATTLRVRARVAVGCPDPDKAIRQLAIGGVTLATATRPAAKSASA
jgi:hypothetical protein